MVNWLYYYLIGCLPAMLAIALVAYRRRESHGMRIRTVANLSVSAGMVWPLLALAVTQVVGLLLLAKVFELIRAVTNRTMEPVEDKIPDIALTDRAPAIVLDSAVAAA